MRWFLEMGYRGEPFHGWQRQPGDVSVQQVLEEALTTVLRQPTPVTGAGRTDAGVNARMMVAHFDTDTEITDADRLIRSLNRLCGKDIAIYGLRRVKDDAHARFDAVSRTYRYFIADRKDPFTGHLTWLCPRLDYDAMQRCADMLLTVSDFTSFAKLHSDAKTNICRVCRAHFMHLPEQHLHVFEITADRFLRNMVRAVVGTLVRAGRHQITPEGFAGIIESKNRCAAGESVPGEALYLWDVAYPDNIYIN